MNNSAVPTLVDSPKFGKACIAGVVIYTVAVALCIPFYRFGENTLTVCLAGPTIFLLLASPVLYIMLVAKLLASQEGFYARLLFALVFLSAAHFVFLLPGVQ